MNEVEIRSKFEPIVIDGKQTNLANYVHEQLGEYTIIRNAEREKIAKKSITIARSFAFIAIGGLIAGVQVALFFVQNQTRTPIRIYTELGLFGGLSIIATIAFAWQAVLIKEG